MKTTINYTQMNPEVLEALGEFRKNTAAINVERASARTEIKAIEAEIADLEAEQDEFVKAGHSIDEALEKYDTLSLNNKINAIEVALKDKVKELEEGRKDAFGLVSDEMYYAYAVAIQKMNLGAKGSVTIGKKTYNTKSSFKQECLNFAYGLGVVPEASEDKIKEKSVRGISEAMYAIVGARKNSKYGIDDEGRMLKADGRKAFAERVIMGFIDYLVAVKKVVNVTDDGTLEFVQF